MNLLGNWPFLIKHSPEDEQSFRQYFLAVDAGQVIFMLYTSLVLVALLAVIDYMFFKFTPAFFALLGVRLIYVGASLYFVKVTRRLAGPGAPAALDKLVAAWWLLLAAVILAVDFSRPPSYTQNHGLYILTIFSCYVLSPTRFASRVVPAVFVTVSSLAIIFGMKDPISSQSASMLIALNAIAHIIGVMVASREAGYRWRQFYTQRQEAATRLELERLATTDGLTGLFNRRYFVQRLEAEFQRYQRYQDEFSLLMIDFDHFKHINDHCGHPAGDEVLRQFSALLREESRTADLLGRLGGEEFAVLCPGTTLPEAAVLAQRIRRMCARICLPGRLDCPVAVSIGVTTAQPGDPSPDALLQRADLALYQAKDLGRDRVETA